MKPAAHVATLITVVVLAGCSADAEPKVEPTESPTQPTSPTRSVEPPEILDPAQTVAAWVDALTLLTQTGTADDIEALSTAECDGCRFAIDPVVKVYDSGGRILTDGVRIATSEVREASPSRAVIVAGLVFAAGTTIPAEGDEPIEFPMARRAAEFRLVADGVAWKVDFIGYRS
jgi:hypothetical protein